MFYATHYDVQAEDLVAAKHEIDIHLTAGVIHQMDIMFEDGCAYDVAVQIFHGGAQIWPSEPGTSFRGNSTIVSFREFFPLLKAVNTLRAVIWTEDAASIGMVVIQFGVLPPEIIQPLSFAGLLQAVGAV